MTVWAQVFTAFGVIGGIAVAVLLYYNLQTPAVWVTFAVLVLCSLWICLSWQKSINEKAAVSVVSPQKSKTVTRQDSSGDRSPNIITGTSSERAPITQKSSGEESPNIISPGEGTSVQIIYGTDLRKDRNAHKDENKRY